jgi:endonuclease VIII
LAGKPITWFEAPRLIGPIPAAGRVVERVESHNRQLDIVWDDGLVLHTHMRHSNGAWHLYRQGERWRESVSQMRVEIHTDQWVAVCFGAPVVETYRQFDRSRHPGSGPLGPDLCRADADIDETINRLYHYHDQDAPVAEALLDEHVARNVGNVYRCEALWACAMHPFAPVSSLDGTDCADLIAAAAAVVRSRVHHVDPAHPARPLVPAVDALDVYGRNGQRCARCGDTVHVCRSGDHAHLLYWCPGCQVRHSPFVDAPVMLDDTREMDPHPAAAQFLSQLPWRRHDHLAG